MFTFVLYVFPSTVNVTVPSVTLFPWASITSNRTFVVSPVVPDVMFFHGVNVTGIGFTVTTARLVPFKSVPIYFTGAIDIPVVLGNVTIVLATPLFTVAV